MTTVTLFGFGVQVGINSRITRDYSTDWHLEFVALDKDGQASYRRQYISGFIAGDLGKRVGDKIIPLPQKESDRILSLTRDERTREQQASVARGSEKFRYHISRPEDSGSKQVDEVAVLVRKYNALTKSQQKKFESSKQPK